MNGRERVRVSAVILTTLTVLTAAAFSSAGTRVLDWLAPASGGQELLEETSSQGWHQGLSALRRASNALEQKSALLNRLLAHDGTLHSKSGGSEDSFSPLITRESASLQNAGTFGTLIHEGATLRQLHRALESKSRLLGKFRREAFSTSESMRQELSQFPAQAPWGSNVQRQQGSEDAAGPLEKKKQLLNDILDGAAFNMGPEESASYHAPETADLHDEIANIKVS